MYRIIALSLYYWASSRKIFVALVTINSGSTVLFNYDYCSIFSKSDLLQAVCSDLKCTPSDIIIPSHISFETVGISI